MSWGRASELPATRHAYPGMPWCGRQQESHSKGSAGVRKNVGNASLLYLSSLGLLKEGDEAEHYGS